MIRAIPAVSLTGVGMASADVIDAFDRAEGGLVVVDGKLIEKPVLRSVHRTLAIAEKIGAA